ncbi:MAG TPA: discoidin domain-containing protein, partial [Polyangiaceae bacterium]|nr:discoidin domain-containing protein [Polyangiaceae bacterium]
GTTVGTCGTTLATLTMSTNFSATYNANSGQLYSPGTYNNSDWPGSGTGDFRDLYIPLNTTYNASLTTANLANTRQLQLIFPGSASNTRTWRIDNIEAIGCTMSDGTHTNVSCRTCTASSQCHDGNVCTDDACDDAPASTSPTAASASANTTVAGEGIDGVPGEFWTSNTAQTTSMWYQVDFGSPTTLTGINVYTSNNDFATTYTVRMSNTSQDTGATVLATTTGATGLVTSTFSAPATGRYVYIRITAVNGTAWWRLSEVTFNYAAGSCGFTNNTVSCDDGNAGTTGDVCSGGTCAGTVPVNCDDGNACTTDSNVPGSVVAPGTPTAFATDPPDPASNAVDGNTGTMWQSGTNQVANTPPASGNGTQWFRLDLGSSKYVSGISINTTNGDWTRGYAVRLSTDGTFDTEPYVTSGSGNAGITNISFTTSLARYILINQTQANASWWSIHEIGVTGPCAYTNVTSGTSCGSATDTACDNPDTCNGSGVCQNNYEATTVNCGDSGTECTKQDKCDGAGSCTDNGFWASGTSCGSATDEACSNPDTCDGAGACNPRHELSTFVCRSSAGTCDVAETCGASTTTCPTDVFASSSTPCGDQTDTECDNPNRCSGSANTCLNMYETSGTICGSPAGTCSNQDTCNGSGTCQPNHHGSGTSCNGGLDTGDCDDPDSCSGSGVCNSNNKASNFVCRGAGADATCDPAETCGGSTTACPGNAFASAGTACGSSTDTTCDNPDTCNGSGVCNVNNEPAGTVCRSAVAGGCDIAETCAGGGAACPADAAQPNGTACTDDGNACTIDICNGSTTCPRTVPTSCQACGSTALTRTLAVAGSEYAYAACASNDFTESNPQASASLQAASNATDGNGTTRWESVHPASPPNTNVVNPPDPSWIYVDLGAGNKRITQVELVWETANAKDYTIGVAVDGAGGLSSDTPWTTIATRTNMAAGARTDTLTGLNGIGRYVRMKGTARTSGYGYSIFEFRVKGDTNTACGTTLLASYAIDGSTTSEWKSAFSDPQWMYVDLGAPGGNKHFSRVVINWDSDSAKNYLLQTAPDGTCVGTGAGCLSTETPWTTIYTSPTESVADRTDDRAVSGVGRYLRVKGTVRMNTSGGYAIEEIDIYGDENDVCGTTCATPCDTCATCQDLTCVPKASGTSCRTAVGDCDLAETCNGSSQACPADGFKSSGSACGSATNTDCDNPDTCNSSGTCLANNELSTFVCRAASGACDVAESCGVGNTGACPTNLFQPAGTACGSASDTNCDNPDTCNSSGTCLNNYELSSVQCRAAAAGGCDIAENCDGSGNCPADAKRPSGFECRAAVGGSSGCDVAESCDGASVNCPADAKRANGYVCRSATLGGCDIEEVCNGVSDSCPANIVQPGGTECRGEAGDCDIAETCNGVADTCPSDVLASSGTECRAQYGVCNPAETCGGSSSACPADVTSITTNTLQAEAAANTCTNCTKNATHVGNFSVNDHILFPNVNMAGVDQLQFYLAAQYGGAGIQARLDNAATGPLLGTLTTTATGGWSTYQLMTLDLSAWSGATTRNLYVRGANTSYLEAECPNTSSGAYTTTNTTQASYSGNGHLTSTGNTTGGAPTTDFATYNFNVSAGTYTFYFRIDSNNSDQDDSFFWRTDGGTWESENNTQAAGWYWWNGGNRT